MTLTPNIDAQYIDIRALYVYGVSKNHSIVSYKHSKCQRQKILKWVFYFLENVLGDIDTWTMWQ